MSKEHTRLLQNVSYRAVGNLGWQRMLTRRPEVYDTDNMIDYSSFSF